MKSSPENFSGLTWSRWSGRLVVFSIPLLATAIVGVLVGAERIEIHDLWRVFLGDSDDTVAQIILWEVRIPRIVVAALVGAALAISGAVLQTLFRNPLAEPYLLGLSSGAAVGAYAAVLMGLSLSVAGLSAMSLMALIGGLATVAIVYRIAQIEGKIPVVTLILAGIVMNAVLSALVLLAASVLERGRMMTVLVWLLGRIDRLDPGPLLVASAVIVSGVLILCSQARALNALVLGEEAAESLGVQVHRVRRVILFVSAGITAVAVSVSGIIGFVGIIVPHAIRILFGPDHRLVLPGAALGGATLLIVADTVARVILRPAEIPVGIVTALFGGPFFLLLLRSRRTHG